MFVSSSSKQSGGDSAFIISAAPLVIIQYVAAFIKLMVYFSADCGVGRGGVTAPCHYSHDGFLDSMSRAGTRGRDEQPGDMCGTAGCQAFIINIQFLVVNSN